MNEDTEESGYFVKTLCDSCEWRGSDPTRCQAFPEGIPIMILVGLYDHRNEYSMNGITDNGLTYSKKEEA